MGFPLNPTPGFWHREGGYLWEFNNDVWTRRRSRIHRDNNWHIDQNTAGGTNTHTFYIPLPIIRGNAYFINFLIRYPNSNVDLNGFFSDFTVKPRAQNLDVHSDYRKTFFIPDTNQFVYMAWDCLMLMPVPTARDIYSFEVTYTYNHNQVQSGNWVPFNIESTVYLPII